MNFKALDAYMDSLYREKSIPGAGVAVSLHGEIIHKYFAGYANVEQGVPFGDDTIFNLYSATKISTVTAAMRLVDKGLLDLDAPAGDYLPELGTVTVCQTDGGAIPAKNVMRVRHLMSMSAGFTYDGDTPAIRALLERTGGRPTTRQVAVALASEPLAFEPGTHFRYSFCHDVLAAVLEAAAGKDFETILKEEVFVPLGMADTVFRLDDEQRKRLAPEYHGFDGTTGTAKEIMFREGLDMGMGPLYRSGGGGLMSTVHDYARLCAMLGNGGITADGKRLLSEAAIRAMQTDQLPPEALPDFEEMGGWSKKGYSYGLGVRTLVDRERNNSLSANGEFGWDGMLGCYVLADPASGVGIFYAQQEQGSQWFNWQGTLRNLAYAAILGREK